MACKDASVPAPAAQDESGTSIPGPDKWAHRSLVLPGSDALAQHRVTFSILLISESLLGNRHDSPVAARAAPPMSKGIVNMHHHQALAPPRHPRRRSLHRKEASSRRREWSWMMRWSGPWVVPMVLQEVSSRSWSCVGRCLCPTSVEPGQEGSVKEDGARCQRHIAVYCQYHGFTSGANGLIPGSPGQRWFQVKCRCHIDLRGGPATRSWRRRLGKLPLDRSPREQTQLRKPLVPSRRRATYRAVQASLPSNRSTMKL